MVAIGLAEERHSGPESLQTLDSREYVRRFLVTTNDKNDGPLTVMNAQDAILDQLFRAEWEQAKLVYDERVKLARAMCPPQPAAAA